MKHSKKISKNAQNILEAIPLEMKKDYAKEFTMEEIANLIDYEEIENDRNFVLNQLSCIKSKDLEKLNKFKKEEDLVKLNEFLNFYRLGEIIDKSIGYYINWFVSYEEIKNAYYMEVQRITYYDEDSKINYDKYQERLTKANEFYKDKISKDFMDYLKKVSKQEELPNLPLRTYYDIYEYYCNYELAINFQDLLEENVQLALFLLILHYPETTIEKITGVSKEAMHNLFILNCFIKKDALESKSLIKKRKKKVIFNK